MTDKVEFFLLDIKEIHQLESLWNKLRLHHLDNTIHFKNHFQVQEFDGRIKPLLEKATEGEIRIEVAKDALTKQWIGYCISSIVAKPVAQGEIESLYVDKGYRGMKIGDSFMRNALQWMDERKVQQKVVAVVAGNESALPFYAKYGFFCRVLVLHQTQL